MRPGQAGPEEILRIEDPSSRMTAFLVIDSTRLGPAFGGIRVRAYEHERDALLEAMDLAAAMTLKAALAELPCGGGKIVVMDRPGLRRRRAWEILGDALNLLNGRFFAGRDYGMSQADLALLGRVTRFTPAEVPAVSRHAGPSGRAPGGGRRGGATHPHPGGFDYGDATARGVLAALLAALAHCRGPAPSGPGGPLGPGTRRTNPSSQESRARARNRIPRPGVRPLEGTHVAVQGLGSVGFPLVRRLLEAGARVTASDPDSGAARRASALGARLVAPARLMPAGAEVFIPAALGGILDEAFAERCTARIVCGPANNALSSVRVEEALMRRGVLVVPDSLAGAGALIAGVLLRMKAVADPGPAIDRIGERVLRLLRQAAARGELPSEAATRAAHRRLARAVHEAP